MYESIPLSELEADAEATAIPSDHSLAEIAQLAERQVALEKRIADAELVVLGMKTQLAKLSGQILPTAMRALGLETLKLSSGETIECKAILRASIPEEHREAAFAWLEEHGFGGLIKHEVSASFGKDEDENAKAFVTAAAGLGVSVEDKRSVHSSTLSAFVAEQDKAGRELPEQILGVFRGDVTKIKAPKKKK
jgi:hypothetical protein